MRQNKPKVKSHFFKHKPGDFLSQKRDGTAIVDFKDRSSLELQLNTGVLENSGQLSCLLKKEKGQAYADWNYVSQHGCFSSSTLKPTDILQYLESVQGYVHLRSTIPFAGRMWVERNFGFYNIVQFHSTVLTENLRDGELEIVRR